MTDTKPQAGILLGGGQWNAFPRAGHLTAREFFTGAEPLLQGVIDALESTDRDVLAGQIHETLALGTRETSLPLAPGPDSPRSSRELGRQAVSIGQEIAAWADEATDRLLAQRTPFPGGPLAVRSHCYGHLLTGPATDLLMGRRGGPVAIQLYNEWQHQMVLLRDALMPFTNWQDIPLLITPEGLRHTEPARDAFLTQLLIRQVRHGDIVAFARRAVTGVPGPDGYGFDTGAGTVLPAVTGQPVLTAPRYLLSWRPRDAGGPMGETVTYVPELRDYYAAPRIPVAKLPPGSAAPGRARGRLVPGPAADGARTAWIEVARDGATARVDLGQALRGHRFARGAPAGLQEPEAPAGTPDRSDMWSVLRAPGLVRTDNADAVVDAVGQDDTVVLALLGKLYPDNVTLRPASQPGAPVAAPGNGRTRFIVDVSAISARQGDGRVTADPFG